MYDPPRIHVGLSRFPTHVCARRAASSSATRLLVPSLKPIRLRGVTCALSVLDVRPKPDCDQRSTTLPRPMRVRLRIAWNATCGSLAHACTTRSPPLRAGSISSPAKTGRSTSASGRCACSPKRSTPSRSKSVAPNPNVTVSDAALRPSLSPVSSGGASGSVLSSPTGRPAVMRRAARVHSRSMSTRSFLSLVVTSNDAMSNLSCAGVTMPAWCGPWNGTIPSSTDAAAGGAARTSVPRVVAVATSAPAPAAPATPRNRRRLTAPAPLMCSRSASPPSRAARPARRSPATAPSCRPW